MLKEAQPNARTDEPREEATAAKQPAFYSRRKKRNNEICQILIRHGAVKPEHVRTALRFQETNGGQIGRILVSMKACTERAITRALLEQVQLQREAGAPPQLALLARKNPELAGLQVACRPAATFATLFMTDVLVLLFIASCAAACDALVAHTISPSLLHYGFSALALCAVALVGAGSYSPIASSPPDEIRTTTLTVTLVFTSVALVAVFRWEVIPWHVYAILAFELVLAWLLLPIVRAVVRGKLARKAWWGVPVVVLGAGKTGRGIVRAMQARPQLGLRPVLVLDDDSRKQGTLRARISAADGIDVHSMREVPAGVASELDLHRSPESMPRPHSSSRIHSSTSDEPPLTIRSPAPTPQEVEPSPSPVVPRPISSRSWLQPSEVPPSTPGRTPRSTSLERESSRHLPPQEPSFLQQIPDSIRGLLRGQFAEIEGVPIVGGLDLAPLLAKRLGIAYAVVAMPGQRARKLLQITERVGGLFPHLLLIPDLIGFGSIGVPAREIAGVVGVEVRRQLLLPGPRFAKRMMDLALAGIGGLFILPIVALLALLVRLDSKGGALYPQKRLGRDGVPFTAFKFRTMHGDGEARLKAVLESDAKLRAEYEEFHKLAFDPRITRVGRILRKYSLDELPQLWNVIRGDMSLVGPRPYLERELSDMKDHHHLILRSMPGLTGLWQVSDRNATSFAERLKMDVQYVRNWSPWLDLYVLARTFGVVIGGTGS
jgi:lipopolysaccharide/colanic/teichoic acid biosynthesis glycosyltransferase